MQTGENFIIEALIFYNLAPFKSLTNCKDFRILSVGSRFALRTSCINSINKLWGATILR